MNSDVLSPPTSNVLSPPTSNVLSPPTSVDRTVVAERFAAPYPPAKDRGGFGCRSRGYPIIHVIMTQALKRGFCVTPYLLSGTEGDLVYLHARQGSMKAAASPDARNFWCEPPG